MSVSALVAEAGVPRNPPLEALAQQAGFWTRRVRDREEALPWLGAVDLLIVSERVPDGAAWWGDGRAPARVLRVGATGAEPDADGVVRVSDDEDRILEVLIMLRHAIAADRRAASLRKTLLAGERLDLLVGRSGESRRLWERLLDCMDDDQPVLVRGPRGAGKQLVAQVLHRIGARSAAPFVRVDCANASELGSLARAVDEARNGTLVLAHAEAPGAEESLAKVWALPEKAGPRIVATASDAPAGASESAFWSHFDLQLTVAPLRERPEDVPVLAEVLLEDLCRLLGVRKRWTSAALARLARHDWPGNVRELRQVVSRAALHPAEDLGVGALVLPRETGHDESDALEVRIGSTIEAVERRLIVATLAFCRGNKPEAARVLGISLKTLYNRLSVYRERTSDPS